MVDIGPLDREAFGRLLALVLQGRPTPELEAELFEESRGLPGRATQSARARMASGDLTWTTRGVDSVTRPRFRGRIFPALVSIPFALLGFLGGEGTVEATQGKEGLQRERPLVVSR